MLSQKCYFCWRAKREKKQVLKSKEWYDLKSDSKKAREQDTFSETVSVKKL